jgi:hypothetical protein
MRVRGEGRESSEESDSFCSNLLEDTLPESLLPKPPFLPKRMGDNDLLEVLSPFPDLISEIPHGVCIFALGLSLFLFLSLYLYLTLSLLC